MKILTLKFRNINSLAGDWEIDFRQPEFTENGLFAITGRTGSGKSSILDAISLALYGKTPRVDVTGSCNDVMTRGKPDCYAEIMFEVGGKVWKSSWKQERTRTKNLKPVQRAIANAQNIIVSDQIKACDHKIVEIVGLTFEQFTKVILLAQGSFAAFLQADKSDKGELLEQITGTEIYGEISKNVFERTKFENQKLEKINIELGAIRMLSNEEIQNLQNEILQFEQENLSMVKELQTLEQSQKWLKDVADLQKQIGSAQTKLPELIKNEEVAKEVLERAEKEVAAVRQEQEMMAPVFLKVRALDTKIVAKNDALHVVLKSLEIIENEKNKLSNNLMQQKGEGQKIRNELTQREAFKQKHGMYESLVGNYLAIEHQSTQVQSRLNDWRVKQTDVEKATKDLDNKMVAHEKAIKDFNAKHQSLEAKMEEWEEQKQKWTELLNGKELPALQSEKESTLHLGNTIHSLMDNLKNILSHKREIEVCEQSIFENAKKEKELITKNTGTKEALENLSSQIDLLRENISFAKTVQSLDERRKHLEDGRECPLCGSKVHPFAMGNLPVMGEKEKQLNSWQKHFEEKSNALKIDEKALAKAASDRENAKRNKTVAERKLWEYRDKNRQLLSDIHDDGLSIQEDVACLEKLEEMLHAKRKEWRQIDALVKNAVQMEEGIKKLRDNIIPAYQQAEKAAEKAKNESETAKRLAEKVKETLETLANQAKSQYETENAALISKLKEYGVENMEQLKKHRNSWMENEENIQKLSRQQIEIEGAIKTTESSIETNQKQFSLRSAEKEQAVAAKNDLITERTALFGDKNPDEEENRLKMRISEAEKAKNLAEKAKNEATTEWARTSAIIQEGENRLREKRAENTTPKTLEELQAEYGEKRAQSDGLLQKIGANKQELKANHEHLEKNRQKLLEKEAQQQTSDRWRRLDLIIGSADGKKYRNFAQALTFENLIILANRQLKKMSERYMLKRADDGANPFELSVIDTFQNCNERTAQNLSGGEKFIVSLALALGLANMASRNMSIDTMFIDEGFGTLDSDYLNVALTALSNLQSEGKLIGVISHLSELKERIVTHIEVIPKGDGHSTISPNFARQIFYTDYGKTV